METVNDMEGTKKPTRTCVGCHRRATVDGTSEASPRRGPHQDGTSEASPRRGLHQDGTSEAPPRRGLHQDEELVRLVLGARGDDGRRPVVVDMAATAFGRGAHVHARPDCLKKAAAGGLARAFKCGVVADAREIGELIALGCSRRIDGLIIGARRAKHVAVGDEARGAMASGAPLVIIARDAGGAVTKGFAQAVLAGNAISYKDKSSLGALLGRDEVAAVVVTDAGIAREIKRAVVLAGGATGGSGPVGTAGVATK